MGHVIVALAVASACVVSAVLLARRPREPVTWVLAAMTAAWTVQLGGAAVGLSVPGRLQGALWCFGLPLLAPLLAAFPDRPRGLNRLVWGYEWVAVLGSAGLAVTAGPAAGGWQLSVARVLLVGLIPATAVSVGLLVRRWRSAGSRERARLGGVMLLAGGVVSAYAVVGAAMLAFGTAGSDGLTDDLVLALLAGGLPAAVGAAVLAEDPLRHPRVPATLAVRGLSVAVTAALALLGAAVAVDVTGSEDPAAAPLLVAVVIAVAAAEPVRRALARPVEALLPGVRAARGVADLGEQLRRAPELGQVPAVVVDTLGPALDVAAVTVEAAGVALATWRRPGDGRGDAGDEQARCSSHPLLVGGEEVGRLVIRPRRGRPLPPDDVLMPLLPHVAVAVAAVRAGRALADASERLADAREAERQRLRADLHDEVGPSVSGIRLTVAAARDRLRDGDAGTADDLLGRVDAEAVRLTGMLRRVLDDLVPDALIRSGLVPALRSRALAFDRPGVLRVSVSVSPAFPALPLPVEVALYRTCGEAVANAARHADASRIDVRLRLDPTGGPSRGVVLEVEDDGRGIPPGAPEGVGLASMRRRAAAAHGTLAIGRAASGGTCVLLTVPVAEADPPASPGVASADRTVGAIGLARRATAR